MISRIRKWWNRDFRSRPPINEDWRVGDMAQCVAAGKWSGDGIGPRRGQVARVIDVVPSYGHDGEPGWFLKLENWPGRFSAISFRKLRPATAEFTARLRKCKPTPIATPTNAVCTETESGVA